MGESPITNHESRAFAEVALDVPLRAGDRVFTFAVPPPLQGRIAAGTPVRVPFGRREAVGFVVGLTGQTGRRVRPIVAVEERLPPLPADLVSLAVWMAGYYVCSVGEAIAAMLPPLSAAMRQGAGDPAGLVQPDGTEPAPAVSTGILAHLDTGSHARVAVVGEDGRFEAYAEAIRWTLARNLGVIVLVPEVSQAERMSGWVARRTAAPVAVLAGHLPPGQRWEIWRQIAADRVRVVVGTRVAAFAPLPRIGLVIVDHEEDASYKEEREPRYHARRVAEERTRICDASLIWGTPAPSLEIVRAMQGGCIAAVTLPPASRPVVAVSDVRAEAGPLGGLFGRRLFQALARTLSRGPAPDGAGRGRAIIFVPRRGYADFLLCHECGSVPRCPRCGVALTYHVERAAPPGLRCHLCGRADPVPEVCPACQGTGLRPHGVGTERVEQAARRLFRSTPLHRLDAEAAPTAAAQVRVWQEFARRGGILIGTQLLIKGVGQVRAPLVGAVGVDAGLHLPDFRAAERTHQVLVRLLRLAEQEMIIQTFSPSHPAYVALARQDPSRFYQSELADRERFGYPPFRPLLNLVVAGPREDPVRAAAGRIAGALDGTGEVLGPSPAPIPRVRGRYRWQVLVKERPEYAARRTLAGVLTKLTLPREIKLTVDVDPVDLL